MQVADLQNEIRPYVLRRMKESVVRPQPDTLFVAERFCSPAVPVSMRLVVRALFRPVPLDASSWCACVRLCEVPCPQCFDVPAVHLLQEKSIPPKEETIIDIELTKTQV